MTKPPKKPSSSTPRRKTHRVGYGTPPLKTRFQPGQSGNPKGRPKGAKNITRSLGETPIADMFIKEANRKITITESGKQKTISVLQATIRSVSVSALKGNIRSQKLMFDAANRHEERQEAQFLNTLRSLYEYKSFWEAIIAQRTGHQVYASDPIPHPDDIIIDPFTGNFRIEGPKDKLDKKSWDDKIQTLVDLEYFVDYLATKLQNLKNKTDRRVIEQELDDDLKLLDAVNKAIGDNEYVKRNKFRFDPSCLE